MTYRSDTEALRSRAEAAELALRRSEEHVGALESELAIGTSRASLRRDEERVTELERTLRVNEAKTAERIEKIERDLASLRAELGRDERGRAQRKTTAVALFIFFALMMAWALVYYYPR